ncbi:hypothetical protein HMJ29_12175 [Hymenobacter taeanensis]|uniref:Macroglobulin domain-containing protein n=1 Tax=Hymenobacter taeanensis TaxID=2735321 RepID=A0A6M6BHZ6_9BACT|nr:MULTISPECIES: hypothetical protein [Hymenobacter]QJX47659.1 hypothetical protein HMJ29_12175 [Hymenobacter taeanensis]UOQ82859.1 hypothetical protein MUN83_08900 [Hymenobacter sp. 5414T-23]
MMRNLLTLLLALTALCAQAAAPPQLLLDVARFRNEDQVVKGGVVEIYATVSGQALTYMRRGPKLFQAAATVTLEVIRPDGSAAYQETVTLKPPVLRDTTAAIKNPISFQKRIALPEGTYTLRGQVRDQYRAGTSTITDLPLVIKPAATKPTLSDVVLLAKPASRTIAEGNNFIRNGFSLTRAPGGMYSRGTEKLNFYAELYSAPVGQPLSVRYRVRATGAAKDAAVATSTVTGQEGRPTPVVGQLDLTKLPAGEYVLTVEIRNAKSQVLSSQTAKMRYNPADYAPAGAVMP